MAIKVQIPTPMREQTSGKAEVEVRTLTAKVTTHQRTVNELRQRVDTIPEVEAQLKQLDRDYNVTKATYEALLQKIEQASLTGSAEENRDDLNFRTLENFVPQKPSSPNRELLVSIVLVLALLAGGGYALLAQQIDPVVSTRKQLRDLTALPVLGVITNALTPAQVREGRRNTQRLVMVSAMLLVAFVITLFLADAGSRVAHELIGMRTL